MTRAIISITLNGERREIPSGSTLDDLVAELGLGDRRIATERNLVVVPRADYASLVLEDGDRLEIVSFVGGG